MIETTYTAPQFDPDKVSSRKVQSDRTERYRWHKYCHGFRLPLQQGFATQDELPEAVWKAAHRGASKGKQVEWPQPKLPKTSTP